MSEVKIYNVGTRQYRVRTPLSDGIGNSTSRISENKQRRKGGKTIIKTIPVAHQLHKFVIGHKGETLAGIREVSHAKVTVPTAKSKKDTIELEGSSDEIEIAEASISKIIEQNIKKIPYTHFISIPIIDSSIQRKVSEFQKEAMGFFSDPNSVYLSPTPTLHITLGMLRLLTHVEVAGAVKLLKSLHPKVYDILGSRSLVVNILNPTSMESNPSKARVIYAKAEDFEGDGRLSRVCEFIREKFDEAGYIDEKRALKIHITVVKAGSPEPNNEDATPDKTRGSRATINATSLLKKCSSLSFGTCRIEQIQIARRFHFAESGAYENEGSILLP